MTDEQQFLDSFKSDDDRWSWELPVDLDWALRDSLRILDDARSEHFTDHEMTAVVVLFSGGNDSTVLTHLMQHHATHAGHIDTTIGIEATRQFVRDCCELWGLPLIVERPDPQDSYAALVVERGFPGPGQHFKMYQRLKERGLRKIRKQFVTDGRKQRVLFIAGRRRGESLRRVHVPEVSRDGSIVWASPIANWSDAHMAEYRRIHPDIPRNEVSDHLHMSGECLCGAFARPGELDAIRFFYPSTAAVIDGLAVQALDNGVRPDRCVWGWGADRPAESSKSGPLCSSCEWRQLELFEEAAS